MANYFITGIGTGVGKTFVSAVLTEALQADYWKPVQCGDEDGTDKGRVSSLITNSKSVVHKEALVYKTPASPHLAAAREGENIDLLSIKIPDTANHLIIEGAGGILVPLNDNDYVIDLARYTGSEVILVCQNYLGCINHSLLSIDYLIKSDFEIKGLVLNGNFEEEVKNAIVKYTELPVIAEIPQVTEVSKETVLAQTSKVNLGLFH